MHSMKTIVKRTHNSNPEPISDPPEPAPAPFISSYTHPSDDIQ